MDRPPAAPDAAAILARHLPNRLKWEPGAASAAALPAVAALVALLDEHGALVQLLSTGHLRRLVALRCAAPAPHGLRADLGAVTGGAAWLEVHSAFEARWRYYLLARELHPDRYRALISFGPAWFLHFDAAARAAEISVCDAPGRDGDALLGSWATRAAAQRAREALDELFDLCRYPEQVRRAPRGTRCVYAELGACDAPCDGSASLESYSRRVHDAWQFAIGTDGGAALRRIESQMRTAADARDFETAARRKKHLDLARRWHAQAGAPLRAAQHWNCLIAVPVIRRSAWKPFLFSRGALLAGPVIPRRRFAAEAAKWAQAGFPLAAVEPRLAGEQTWLVAQLRDRARREAHFEWFDAQPPANLELRLTSAIAAWKAAPDALGAAADSDSDSPPAA